MITPETRQRILQRDGWLCQLCRNAAAASIDHVWPQILGGTDDDANLQAACKSCNARKGVRPPNGMLPLFSATAGERAIHEGLALPVRFEDDEREAVEQFKAERCLPSLNYAVRLLVRLGTGLERSPKESRR